MNNYEAPDISTEMALRQSGEAQEGFIAFQSIRELAGSADATFSFGVRASRPASGLSGDRYFATDRNWLYVYSGTAWLFVSGVKSGTDAARAAITPDATDNGAYWWATDTLALWHVAAGLWAKLLEIVGTANQITAGIAAGVLTLGLAQETGWTAATGTANKGVFATYAGQNVSAVYVEAEAQITDDAAKANSQRIKAIEDTLRAHGLIN